MIKSGRAAFSSVYRTPLFLTKTLFPSSIKKDFAVFLKKGAGMHRHEYNDTKKRELRLYATAIILSLVTILLEYSGALWFGSVALFADMLHVAADGSTYLMLGAVAFITVFRPEKENLLNKYCVWTAWVLLLIADIMIFNEAISRIYFPREVIGEWTLYTAFLGLVLNAIIVFMMHKTPKEERDIRHHAMDAHALSDLMVSVGVIFSAVVIMTTGFQAADWIVALAIALYLFAGPLFSLTKKIQQGEWTLEHEHHHEHDHHHHH